MSANADEQAGYGHPPKHTRWRKGQSGNPKGRPRSKPDMLNEAVAILAEPVRARTPEGKTVSLDGIEAGYLALCKKGLMGHVPSLISAIRWMLESQPVLAAREEDEQTKRARIIANFERMGITTIRD